MKQMGEGPTHSLPLVLPSDQAVVPKAFAANEGVLGLWCLSWIMSSRACRRQGRRWLTGVVSEDRVDDAVVPFLLGRREDGLDRLHLKVEGGSLVRCHALGDLHRCAGCIG